MFCFDRLEHWLKLHQFLCEVMRGDKTLPGSKHDRASCLVCKEDSQDSEVENNNAPLLGCYLPNNFVPTHR